VPDPGPARSASYASDRRNTNQLRPPWGHLGDPDLGQVGVIDVVGRARAAHLGRHPAGLQRVREGGKVKVEEHTQWVGAIVTNLQALETVLRYFLAKLRNEIVEFPKVGDQTVKLTYLTRRTSLGKLIRTFNEALTHAEKNFKVDIGVVHIRDAIAHGRLVTAVAGFWSISAPRSTNRFSTHVEASRPNHPRASK
jgi:hypothetical protein